MPAVLAFLLAGCGADQPPGPGVSSGTTEELAVGASRSVTLKVPCGVPPLEVGGELYDSSTYTAPAGAPDGWGEEQSGTLRRENAESLLFLPDDGTVRLQFMKSAPGRRLPSCG